MGEIPLLKPDQLREEASHIFTGKLKRIYATTERTGPDFERQLFVGELRVSSVEKGAHRAPLAYVRFWRQRYVGKGNPPPGHYGHRNVPQAGADATVYVRQAEDGGFDVLSPNGFATAKNE
jgi:hypothetical protein